MVAEKMYLLDLGQLSGDIGWFLPGRDGGAATKTNRNQARRWVDVPVDAALIIHEDGIILFDSGPSSDANETRPIPTTNFPITRFNEENMLEKQLALVGYKPEDIDYIVLSHLHWDHIGQLNIFKELKTPIIVQKKELEWALYSIWIGKGVYYTFEDMNMLRNMIWYPIDEKIFELFDGVTLYWTGGHTPGHQIAKVTLRSGNCYFLLGDFLHIPEEYEKEAKGWLLADSEEWLTELRKLKLREKTQNCKLVISHDPDLWKKFPKAPNPVE